VTWTRWDAGLPPQPLRPATAGQNRLLVLATTHAIDECGTGLLSALDVLLTDEAAVTVTLTATKTWSRRDRRRITVLGRNYGRRFRHEPAGPWDAQVERLARHDWLVLPDVRGDFGVHAARATACGVPVIAHDVEPFSELVHDGRNGLLVPCELYSNWLGAPAAAFTAAGLIARMRTAAGEPARRAALLANDWRVAEHTAAFTTAWLGYLGLT